jgi:broad specificity phosphatase PhoE
MELVLVRHALPVRIDATHDGSPADPELSEIGVEQAQRVITALALDDVTHVYSSPAARALQTAAPLVDKLDLDLVIEPGIAEFDKEHGSYVPVEELRAENDPRWHALVAGEMYGIDAEGFQAGVVAAVEAIVQRHPGGRAVLFSHSGAINAYTAHVTGQSKVLWFAPAYASITRIGAARDGRRGVTSLNETGHVRDLLTF